MTLYKISPHAHILENRLLPSTIQYGIFHQLTGYVIEPRESVKVLLFATRMGSNVSIGEHDLDKLGDDGAQLRELIAERFLILSGEDPFDSFPSLLEQFVVRPMQNPALTYRDKSGEIKLVGTSMAQRIYSPRRNELQPVIEETMPADAASVVLKADGTRTLGEIFAGAGIANALGAGSCREPFL